VSLIPTLAQGLSRLALVRHCPERHVTVEEGPTGILLLIRSPIQEG
jgi:hypothetical protein